MYSRRLQEEVRGLNMKEEPTDFSLRKVSTVSPVVENGNFPVTAVVDSQSQGSGESGGEWRWAYVFLNLSQHH